MVDLTVDLAYESLSENSSKVARSSRLSSSSLSGSSQTHSSGNSYRCATCNKKLTKRKALRQNAIESDDYLTDPFDSKLPGSQITLTPDVTPAKDLTKSSNHAALFYLQGPMSSTSSTSTGKSRQRVYCKQCTNSRRKNDSPKKEKYTNGNGNSKRDTSLLNIIKSTFAKLFDSKSKSPSKLNVNATRSTNSCIQSQSPHISRKLSHCEVPGGGYVSINNGHSDIVTTPGSSIIYDSFSADSGRNNGVTSSAGSTRNSICSLGTLSLTTTNDLQQSSDPHEFSIEIRNQRIYRDYIRSELDYDRLNRRNPRMFDNQARSHASLMPTHSCPPKSKSLCSQFSRTNRGLLCSSWPPSGHKMYLQDKDLLDNCDEELIFERVDRYMQSKDRYEFNIPFCDIKLGEIIKSGSKRKIYKGHWHGDVTVFMFENLDHDERSRFWENVSNLTMIRHENIVLFMGASMEPPHFLMVTSACNGLSLYEKIHMSREKMRQSFKVNLMRQISQAVGYLHAKNKPIIVKRLNSRNIYLEPKVVLSLLDYSQLDQDDIETFDHISIPCHLIWYAAPELLDPINKDLPRLVQEKSFTQCTDIYSFGTLLYEIHMGRYPYSKTEVNEYISDVCSGKRPDIKDMKASETVKSIIRECWSHDSLNRPEFANISQELMKRDASRKRHSSSVPGNLNRDMSMMSTF